jgi:hypothetical protein
MARYLVEAGSCCHHECTLPFISRSVTYVTDSVSNHHHVEIDEYVQDLLKLGPYIMHSQLVQGFFFCGKTVEQ